MKWIFLLVLSGLCQLCAAETTCEVGRGVKTEFGRLSSSSCKLPSGGYHTTLSLDSLKLAEDNNFYRNDRNEDRSIWIFTSGTAPVETGCAANLYLIDLSRQPVKVIAFGVKSACNEFHWASWGKKRSVIALKNNVKFVYEDGKLTPPKQGEMLASMIEPPHSSRGGGMDEETAIPFAQEVPLPK